MVFSLQLMVEEYGFGYIVVDGMRFERDIVVTPVRVVSNWWRIEGHRLQLDDVKDYLDIDVEAVVIGTGYSGFMHVDSRVIEEFRKRGREVYVLKSSDAVKKYNELIRQGKKTLLLIHLTC